METLILVPRGNVDKDYDWGTRVVSFENGNNQYQRVWTKPRITLSFKSTGNVKMKNYLEDFFEARSGNYEAFKWEYNDKEYIVRFADKSLKMTDIRGYSGEGVVGFECNVSLSVCKEGEY